MVKVYSISLALGVVGLLIVILGGALVDGSGYDQRDPNRRLGASGRAGIGGLVGFGMGGLSAEFSTLDLSWPGALAIAFVGLIAGGLWAWRSSRSGSRSDAGSL